MSDIKIEEIWKEFSGKLRQFISNKVSDSYFADEILQEVFIKIHAGIDTLRDDEKISGWVFQIARNKIIDYYRQNHACNIPLENIEYSETVLEADLNREFEEDVREMIGKLPEKYRQALIMTEYDGLTQKQLSQKLDISLSGAKSRVQRGRQMLKDMLMQCCHIEFDLYGNILDFHPHACCCCSPQACS